MNAPTADDLAAFLSLPADERMVLAVEAAVEWAQDRRSCTLPPDLWRSQRARYGTVLYASLLYQSRATPTGFAGYEEAGGYWNTGTPEALYRARDLVGVDLVIA